MKKLLLLFFTSVLLLSCNKEPVYQTIEFLGPQNVQFVSSGGVCELEFKSASDYVITADAEWIQWSVSKIGRDKYMLKIMVDANESYQPRRSAIRLSCGDVHRKIDVGQDGIDEGDIEMTVKFQSVSLDASGDEITISVGKYTDFEVQCEEEWCKVEKVTDNNDCMISIKVEANNSETRYSEVELKSKYGKPLHTLSVKQLSMSEQNNSLVMETTARSSLFQIFTATWCPFSPLMITTCERVKDMWEGNIEIVNIHVNESELFCEESRYLSTYYDNDFTPSCILDGRMNLGNVSSGSLLNSMTAGQANVLEYSRIQCENSLKGNEICVNVRFPDLKAGRYSVRVWLLEDNIVAGQEDNEAGTYHPEFNHQNVLIKSISSVLGDEFVVNSNTYKGISYSFAIPEDCDISQSRILVTLLKEAEVNGVDFCYPFYVDNCMSIPLGNDISNGGIENIVVGDDINCNE